MKNFNKVAWHAFMSSFKDNGNLILKIRANKFIAFTLAEMMVVMLIMSIIMAAIAPIVTTKAKNDKTATSSPWKWVNNIGPDAYFGNNDVSKAMIGQQEATASDTGRLILNTSDEIRDHIIFKDNGHTIGKLQMVYGSSVTGTNLSNITLGSGSLRDGDVTIAIGNKALSNYSGDQAIAIGANANGDDGYSTAVGTPANPVNGTIALGVGSRATANGTIAIGSQSGVSIAKAEATAERALAVGSNTRALGAKSIAIGNGDYIGSGTGTAQYTTASGNNSIAIGHRAQATAVGGIAIGNDAKATGLGSLTIGNTAGNQGTNNTAIGTNALFSAQEGANSNTAVGYHVLSATTTGSSNTGLGTVALHLNSTGSQNTAAGDGALFKNTTGSGNTAIGTRALSSNSSGNYNVAIGQYPIGLNGGNQSASAVNTGHYNIAVGKEPLYKNSSGNYNVVLGYQSAFDNTSGSSNVAIGTQAMSKNTTGSNNIAIGYGALSNNVSGQLNIAIGNTACANVKGSNKVCIGNNSGPSSVSSLATDANDVIFLGDENTTVYIPGNLFVGRNALIGADSSNRTDSNNPYKLYLKAGNKSKDSKWVYLGTEDYKGGDDNFYRVNPITIGPFTIDQGESFDADADHPSDRRLKYVGTENKSGLDKIRQLKVFNYTFKRDKKKTPRVGVIAQDLQKVFPDAVTRGQDGFLMIRMEDMFFALVNAVKELDAHLTKFENIIKQVQKDNAQLKKENAELKARLDKIEAKLK